MDDQPNRRRRWARRRSFGRERGSWKCWGARVVVESSREIGKGYLQGAVRWRLIGIFPRHNIDEVHQNETQYKRHSDVSMWLAPLVSVRGCGAIRGLGVIPSHMSGALLGGS